MKEEYKFELVGTSRIVEAMALYRSLIGTEGLFWDENYPAEEHIRSDVEQNALYCLTRNGEIVALAFCGEDSDAQTRITWKLPIKNPAFFARLGVAKQERGKGLASLIIKNIIETAKSKGYDGIRLLVSQSNPPAIALYNKLNFQSTGTASMWDIDWYCREMLL